MSLLDEHRQISYADSKGSYLVFNLNLPEQKNKFLDDFKAKRKQYFTFGSLSIILFLTLLYLGPLEGLERFGFFGLRKGEEQPSLALTNDSTWSPSVSLVSTYKSISVYGSYQNDLNQNNSAFVEYRRVGDSTWKRGMEMAVDRRDSANQWRGSIFELQPDTDYEVRVTFEDADGVEGSIISSQLESSMSTSLSSPIATATPAVPSPMPSVSSLASPNATFFVENFESGDINLWTSSLVEAGNTLEVINPAAYQGGFGMRVKTGGSSDDATVQKNIGEVSELYMRVMVKLASDVSEGYHQIFMSSSTAEHGSDVGALAIRRKSDDQNNNLFTLASGSYEDTGVDLELNRWYCLETQAVVGVGAGLVRAWVDGKLVADRQNLNTGTTSVSWLRIGADAQPVTSEYHFDDFGASSSGQIGCLSQAAVTEPLAQIRGTHVTAVEAVVKTRSDNFPSLGKTYHVSTSGSDTNAGTEALPFRMIQKAANTVSVGDKVLIHAGFYNEMVTINASGNVNNYIVFEAAGDGEVVIDGGCTRTNNILINGNFIRISSLTMKNAQDHSILTHGAGDFSVIENNKIMNWDCNDTGPENQAGIASWGSSSASTEALTIRNNTISRSIGSGSTSSKGDGIWIKNLLVNAGGGHAIYGNTITGPNIYDAIGGEPENDQPGGLYRDSDIYNNTISGCFDDALQIEGQSVNLRVWNNTLSDCIVGVGIAPIFKGPVYIVRNVIYDIQPKLGRGGGVFKAGDQSVSSLGKVFIFHNTLYTTFDMGGLLQSGGGVTLGNFIFKNNTLRVGDYVVETTSHTNPMEFNNNNLYTSDTGGKFAKWNGTVYSSFESFKSGSGQEASGMSTNNEQFVNVASRDFRLQSTSPLVDKGVVISGVNDADSSWPYAGAAPDNGAFESGAASSVSLPRSSPSPSPLTASSPAPSPAPSPAAVINPIRVTLQPIADAYVDKNRPSVNFGGLPALLVDGRPVRITYMKFDLTSVFGPVTLAKLRIRVTNSSSSTQNFKLVENSIWQESLITYNNRPTLGAAQATISRAKSGTFVEVDLTSAVLAKLGGLMTIGIDSSGSDGLDFNSRDASADRPVLIIQ